ncbi:DoxX family protein [Candidatus Parcubacteria bacterium]|nr:MAG: DoxX family protein [Candidatus Parcubacteria bacterium]
MTRDKAIDISVFLLRVVSGLLFLQAGGLKLFGWFGGMPEGMELTPLIWTAGVLEVAGGIAMILGLFTRPVAFVLSGEMAVAYFIGHASQGHFFVPLLNQGQPAVLFAFIFLFLAAYGAGSWSIDAKRGK